LDKKATTVGSKKFRKIDRANSSSILDGCAQQLKEKNAKKCLSIFFLAKRRGDWTSSVYWGIGMMLSPVIL